MARAGFIGHKAGVVVVIARYQSIQRVSYFLFYDYQLHCLHLLLNFHSPLVFVLAERFPSRCGTAVRDRTAGPRRLVLHRRRRETPLHRHEDNSAPTISRENVLILPLAVANGSVPIIFAAGAGPQWSGATEWVAVIVRPAVLEGTGVLDACAFELRSVPHTWLPDVVAGTQGSLPAFCAT